MSLEGHVLSERVWSHKEKYYMIPPEELARLVKSIGAERRLVAMGAGSEEMINVHSLWRLLTQQCKGSYQY